MSLASGAAARVLPRGSAELGRAAKPTPITANIPIITVRIFFLQRHSGLVFGCENLRVPAWHSSSQFGRQIVSSPGPADQFRRCQATRPSADPFLRGVIE